jgi:hypothetical protein
MSNFHHKTIKRFTLSGIIQDESALGRLKNEYARLLTSEMRLSGYVPRIDIDTDFTIDYNETKNYFEFEISLHGVYAGRKRSEWILGIDVNKPIYIQKSKSKELLQAQASPLNQK